MKFRLRVTLMTILLSLIGATTASLGIASFIGMRSSAADLSGQILDQTSLRVGQEVDHLLEVAASQGRLDLRLLRSGRYSARDFPHLAAFWVEVMQARPELTRLSVGLEADGAWSYVRRLPDGRLAVGELRRDARTGRLRLSDYWPADYPRKPFYVNGTMDDEDPRPRPWYTAARHAGRQVWSESYEFFGVGGVADTPGVSCATPVYGDDGALVGVLTASFGLDQLCRFLRGLSIGRNGFAFVVEARKDGTRRVIAHPDADSLLRVVRQEGDIHVTELVPPEELPDPRVGAFLAQVPEATRQASKELVAVRFECSGVRYVGGYRAPAADHAPTWLLCVALPEEDVLGRARHNDLAVALVGLVTLALAVLAARYVSGQVARPLEVLALDAQAVGRLEIEPRPVA